MRYVIMTYITVNSIQERHDSIVLQLDTSQDNLYVLSQGPVNIRIIWKYKIYGCHEMG